MIAGRPKLPSTLSADSSYRLALLGTIFQPPSLLSFTWISRHTDHKPTVVTIEFHERGTGTELVLTHRQLPPKEVEGHRKGWTDIVRLLDEALTRG